MAERLVAQLFGIRKATAFRHFNHELGHYTWWDYKTRARERNVGWRIDYFFVSRVLKKYLKGAFIRPAVMGSDHCPLGIEIELP